MRKAIIRGIQRMYIPRIQAGSSDPLLFSNSGFNINAGPPTFITVPITYANKPSSLVLVGIYIGNGGHGTVASVTDTLGNVYTQLKASIFNASLAGGTALEVWQCVNPIPGTGTLTVTSSAAPNNFLGYGEVDVVHLNTSIFKAITQTLTQCTGVSNSPTPVTTTKISTIVEFFNDSVNGAPTAVGLTFKKANTRPFAYYAFNQPSGTYQITDAQAQYNNAIIVLQ